MNDEVLSFFRHPIFLSKHFSYLGETVYVNKIEKKINPKYLSTKVKILKRMQKLVKYSIRFRKFLKISKSFEIQKILKRLLVILRLQAIIEKAGTDKKYVQQKNKRKIRKKAIIWFSSIHCLEVCTGNRNDHWPLLLFYEIFETIKVKQTASRVYKRELLITKYLIYSKMLPK